ALPLRDRKALLHAEVERPVAGAANRADAGVAEGSRRGGRVGRGIKPLRARTDLLGTVVAVADTVGAGAARDRAGVVGRLDGPRETGLGVEHSAELPA